MRPIPDIMQHPQAIATTEHYRAQFVEMISRTGEFAAGVNAGATVPTMLSASFGALDAGICGLMFFHTCEGGDFDPEAFTAMVRARLERCLSPVERANCGGGVQ